jgi:phage-related protein
VTGVNKVWVTVAPDTSKFRRETLEYLKTLEKNLQVVVKLVLDKDGLKAQTDAAIKAVSGRTIAVGVDVDDTAAKKRLDELGKAQKATINADADTGKASAQIDVASRNRKVEFIPDVSKAALVKVGSLLAGYTGLKTAQQGVQKFGAALASLGEDTPRIASAALAVGSLGSLALSSVSGLVTMAAALAPIGALVAPLPGFLLAGGAAVAVFAMAMKDAKTQLAGLKPAFDQLQNSVSAAFWAKAKAPIVDMVKSVLPSLQKGLTGVGSALGAFSGSVAGSFQKAFGPAVISGILGPLATSISNATKGTDSFAQSLASLGTFGAKYLPSLGTMFSNLAVSFNGWIQGVVKNGQLASWVQSGVSALRMLGSIAQNAFGIISGVANAAFNAGGAGLQTFANALATVNNLVNSSGFQTGLTDVFTGAAEGAAALGNAMGPIAQLFQTLAPVIGAALTTLATTAADIIGNIAVDLNQPGIAAGLTAAINGIAAGFEALLPALPGVLAALSPILTMIGTLASTIGPILAAALTTLQPVLGAVTTALQPLIVAVGPILQQAILALQPAFAALAAAVAPIAQALIPVLTTALQALAPMWPQIAQEIVALAPVAVQLAQLLATVLIPAIKAIGPVLEIMGATSAAVFGVLATIVGTTVRVVSDLLHGNFVGAFRDAVAGVKSAVSQVGSAVSGIEGMVQRALAGAGTWLLDVGGHIVDGLEIGLAAAWGRVTSYIHGLAMELPKVVREALGIHSPSKVFQQIGNYVGTGLTRGLNGSVSGVKSSARSMTNALVNEFNAEDQIRQKNQAIIAAAESATNPLQRTAAGRARLAAEIAAANQKIAAAPLTKGDETRALAAVSKANTELTKYAAERSTVATKLTAANKALVAAQKQVSDYTTTAEQSLGTVSVTSASTPSQVISLLQQRLSNVKTYTSVLTKLRKEGLDDTTFQQLISAGVDALPLAQSLLAGGAGNIKQIASLQSQITSASSTFASSAANSLYGAGVQAAQGLVKGLQSQQAAIAKQMASIAASMVATIKSNLGIHSPSKVMELQVGRWIPAGLAKGITGGYGAVSSAMNGLVSIPSTSSVTVGVAGSGSSAAPVSKTYAPVIQNYTRPLTPTDVVNAMHQIDVLVG